MRSLFRLACCTFVSAFVVVQRVNASAIIRPIALSGDQTTGTAGYSFFKFYTPSINRSGTVAFGASLQPLNGHYDYRTTTAPPDRGVWKGTTSAVTPIVTTWSTKPSIDQAWKEFPTALIDDGGRVVFVADNLKTVGNSSNINSTLWAGSGGALQLIARKDDLPGREGAAFSFVSGGFTNLRMNRGGDVTFAMTLSQPSPYGSQNAIWTNKGGSSTTSMLAKVKSGAPAPYTTYETIPTSTVYLNNQAKTSFNGSLLKTPTTADDVSLVSQSGGAAAVSDFGRPLVTGGTPNMRGLAPASSGFNDEGERLYSGLFTSTAPKTGTGLALRGTDGTYRVIARTWQQADDLPSGVIYADRSTLDAGAVLTGAGTVIFRADISGTGITSSNDRGLWIGKPGDVNLVARRGDDAPGLGSSVDYNDFLSVMGNNNGDIAFLASLQGAGIDSTNNVALFMRTAGGFTEMIARESQVIDVDPGSGVTLKTIDDTDAASITLYSGSGGEDGAPTSFADNGRLAFRLTFSDGSQGIFTTVPEPSSAFAVAFGLFAFTRRPRRRKS